MMQEFPEQQPVDTIAHVAPEKQPKSNILVILTGATGVGKDTVCAELETAYGIPRIVTYTTRRRGSEEKDGVDYHFVSDVAFDRLVAKDQLLEWTQIGDRRYGTHQLHLPKGSPVAILRINPQGVLNILELAQERLTDTKIAVVWLCPPIFRKTLKGLQIDPRMPMETIFSRLERRGRETGEALEERKRQALKDEIALFQQVIPEVGILGFYAYMIFNPEGKPEEAAREVHAIIEATKCQPDVKLAAE